MPVLITSEVPTPQVEYVLPAQQSFRLLMVGANFDGSGSLNRWLPTVAIFAPDGWEAFLFGQDVLTAVGDNVYCTFAPYLSPPDTPTATGQYVTQTGMPQIDLGPGWIIHIFARPINSQSADVAVVIDNSALLVEPMVGGISDLAFGPFMLVPGPHSGL